MGKAIVGSEVVFHGGLGRASAGEFLLRNILAVGEKVGDSAGLFRSQIGKAGHATFAIANGGNDLREVQMRADFLQGWKFRRRAGERVAMAETALADVQGAGAGFVPAGGEGPAPAEIVRIDGD